MLSAGVISNFSVAISEGVMFAGFTGNCCICVQSSRFLRLSSTAAVQSSTMALSASQVSAFRRDGFVVVRGLIAWQVSELLADYDRALRGEIEVPEFGDRQGIDGAGSASV